jgi:CRP-like cAMP-binding protein
MFKSFGQFLVSECSLTDSELQMMEDGCTVRFLRKKQLLQQAGEVSRFSTVIAKGCMRMYRIDEQGNEHTLSFGTENWWMMDKESFINGTPSKYYIEALEDCQVLLWPKETFAMFLDVIPTLRPYLNQVINNGYIAMQNRLYQSISTTAEERYHNFIKTYPDILNRVPLHMIASYLGVSRETLSRVRNQYAFSR